MNGLISRDSSLRREGPRARAAWSNLPSYGNCSRVRRQLARNWLEMHGYLGASGELVRVRQTIRALDRRYDFANYRDF